MTNYTKPVAHVHSNMETCIDQKIDSDQWPVYLCLAEPAAARIAKLEVALNHIASWGEGAMVNNSFNEPWAAQIARAALKDAA